MTGDADRAPRGLLDTNILIHWPRLAPAQLPVEASISAVTLAELAAAIHADVGPSERAARVDLLERAESVFEPLPFDTRAARMYGRIAAANGLPLFTTNVGDFTGLDGILQTIPVKRPDR